MISDYEMTVQLYLSVQGVQKLQSLSEQLSEGEVWGN